MKADATLINIIKEVGDEIYYETGVDLSDAELASIIDSQFSALELGINKGFNVRLPNMGKFMNVNSVKENKQQKISKKEIEELKKIEGDYVAKEEELKRKLAKLKRKKEYMSADKTVSFKSVMKTNSKTKGSNSTYNKLLNTRRDE